LQHKWHTMHVLFVPWHPPL